MKINFIDLAAQYQAYQQEMEDAVLAVMRSGQFIMGKAVSEFEQQMADYVGCKHVIGCSSGSDALLMALMALDIGPGDEVIVPAFSFIATATCVSRLGATPVFVDVAEDIYNLDTELLAKAITSKTKAIIPVSLYGQVADMEEINAIAGDIPVIEDAAQSFGADYQGKKSCNLSTIGCTSFFPSKPLGAYGDGGAITTNDAALAEKLRSLRVHGQTARYYHEYLGIGGRLDTMQAAVLQVKLAHFPDEAAKRVAIGQRYSELLADADVVTPFLKSDRNSMYAQYSVRVADREAFVAKLQAADVPTAVHYPMGLHLQPCFAKYGYQTGDCPVTERVSQEIVSLPMSAFLTEAQQDYVVAAIK